MNDKWFLAWLSLMCFVSQIRAWKWLDVTALNAALEDDYNNTFPFQGYNIEGNKNKAKSFRLKICEDATKNPYPMFSIINKVNSTVVIDLKINISGERLNGVEVTKKAFYCGARDDYHAYYYGQGPYKNSIAVYLLDPTIKNSIANAHGIMTYDLD